MQQNIIFQCISKILLYLHYFEIVFHQDHFELYNKVVIYIKHGKDCRKLYKRTCEITQVAMILGEKDFPHFLDTLYSGHHGARLTYCVICISCLDNHPFAGTHHYLGSLPVM